MLRYLDNYLAAILMIASLYGLAKLLIWLNA
jgi:hypothetical protein